MVNDYDLSTLSYMISGAAPLSLGLAESLKTKLKGKTAIIQGYVSLPLLHLHHHARLTSRRTIGNDRDDFGSSSSALKWWIPWIVR